MYTYPPYTAEYCSKRQLRCLYHLLLAHIPQLISITACFMSRVQQTVDVSQWQSMASIVLRSMLISLLFVLTVKAADSKDATEDMFRDEELAKEYIYMVLDELCKLTSLKQLYKYEFNVNITEENQLKMMEARMELYAFSEEVWRTVKRFDYNNFKNETLKRMFKKLSVIGNAGLPHNKLMKLNSLEADMTSIYSTTNICVQKKCHLELDPDLQYLMERPIHNYDVVLEVWLKWRLKVGRPMREIYIKYIALANEAAKLNGFKDATDLWLFPYETPTFQDDIEEVWQQLRPLYLQLHAYIRRKLKKFFPDKMPQDGTIPAHILGNMWAQDWTNLEDFVKPYNKTVINVTHKMKSLGWNATKMFRVAEDFFISLGLDPMSESFWKKSMITKPTNRTVVCHASAWDLYNGTDFRIKQCTQVSMNDLIIIHHEMGHIQYYSLYRNQPAVFREGANPGFHEAVGDLMALSVSTHAHLKILGLLDEVETDRESEINYLLTMALHKIAFLPFAYMIDQWRWGVFSGNITAENLNRKWWELRLKYQGITPPVKRSENDFDPGAKYHISNNVPYIRYFVSYIIQFQFHKALCDRIGFVGPLHRCDIYKSKEAGKILRDSLSLGSSRPWWEVMKIITGQEKMDARGMREYFHVLEDWLTEKNKGEELGWDSATVDDYFSGTLQLRCQILMAVVCFCVMLMSWQLNL